MKPIKYIIITTLISFFLLVYTGCEKYPDRPEDVVRKQWDAIKTWDIKTAFSYVHYDDINKMKRETNRLQKFSESSEESEIETKKKLISYAYNAKITKVEVNADKAKVYTEELFLDASGKQLAPKEEHRYELIKKDGRWLIDAVN